MNMIERVAESQAKFDGRTLISMPRFERDRYLDRARAAIEAMREPTDKMFQAGSLANVGPRSSSHGFIFKSMIDAALGESEK